MILATEFFAVALAQAPLAGHTSFSVVDVTTGQVLARQGELATEPASTLKLLTAAAALIVLDPQTRLKTRVVSVPGSNQIVLVGDGDATLASTTAAAAAAGSGTARHRAVRVVDEREERQTHREQQQRLFAE